ncbi:MAG: DUF3606 domain-containing protein [Rubrivivax sp.]|nr:MAG: DUF3606 domain-containing protein [Rubrivivax sp.]
MRSGRSGNGVCSTWPTALPLEATMSVETNAAEDSQSTEKVDLSDKASLERWAKALGLTTEALQGAVQKVGPRVDKIKDYLTGGMASDQEDA